MKNWMFALAVAVAGVFVVSIARAEERYFSGAPQYENAAAQRIVERMIAAHGGLEPWEGIDTMSFRFVTKVVGAPSPQPPFYSIETSNLNTGQVIIDWPWFNAETVWNGEEAWSRNWPIPPLPTGFFTKLTSSFITLPWLTQTDGVKIGAPTKDRLPEKAQDDKDYDVVRMTFDNPNPSIPGEYYDVFIDPDTHLMRAVRFNITHPAMVRIAGQPVGPNVHVFSEYHDVNGLKIPAYYYTYGGGAAAGPTVDALHIVFGLQMNAPFDEGRLAAPEDARLDEETASWWAQ